MSIDFNSLPICLQPYQVQILETQKESIEMTLLPSEHLNLWQSKVGGEPYLPIGQHYPQTLDAEN